MGVSTFNQEFTSPVAPARLFKALIFEYHILMPKLLPQQIKSIEYVHGNGEVGTIQQTNFAAGPFKFMKYRMDEIDEANFVSKYTVTEGDMLADVIEFIANELKLEAASGGGCVGKMTMHVHAKGDIVLQAEDVKDSQEQTMGYFKAIEAYLLANPTACI